MQPRDLVRARARLSFGVLFVAASMTVVGCGLDSFEPDASARDAGAARDVGTDGRASMPEAGPGRDAGFDARLETDAGGDAGPTRRDAGDSDAGDFDAGDFDGGLCGRCDEGQLCCPEGLYHRCIEPRVDGSCPLPDLTVSSEAVLADLTFRWEYFDVESCALVEGCVVTPGWRRLMRFPTKTPNIGDADMRLGRPGEHEDLFQYSECHEHYHFNGYADYRLVKDVAGTEIEVGRGHKQAFCLLDSERISDAPGVPREARYDCGSQGIQRGWSDVYTSDLDCQWIDVTDVEAGDYTLRISINYERTLIEERYDNNVIDVDLSVPPDVDVDVTAPCTGPFDPSPFRDCGWQSEGMSRTCTPGEEVAIGCGSGCGLEGATCSGDPIVRVCEGEMPCAARTSLAIDDDSCGRRCPLATFTCPASGVYNALTAGARRLGNLCTLAVRAPE